MNRIRNSIKQLISETEIKENYLTKRIASDTSLTYNTKNIFLELFDDTSDYPMLEITHKDIALAIWCQTVFHHDAEKIKDRLNIEMYDVDVTSHTNSNRIIRLLNCLIDFSNIIQYETDDTKLPKMIISHTEKILRSYDVYSTKFHVVLAIRQLQNAGFSPSAIDKYIESIDKNEDNSIVDIIMAKQVYNKAGRIFQMY